MGAASMGGAAAAANEHRRLLEKIDQAFDSVELRQDARTVLDLIETESGSLLVVVIVIMLTPGIYFVSELGEIIGGDLGMVIGMFIGLGILFGAGSYIDNRLFRRPARKRLQKFVETHPQGKFIEQKVREIIRKL